MNNRRSFFAKVIAAGAAVLCGRPPSPGDGICITSEGTPNIYGNHFRNCFFRGERGDGIYIRGPGKDFAITSNIVE